MKKLIFLLTLPLLLVFMGISVFAESKAYDAVKGTPVIDGEIDEIWDHAAVSTFDGFNQNTTDTSGDVKLMWDEKNLYVLIEVSDKVLSDEANSWWEKDGITVYMDEYNKKLTKWEKEYPVTYACNFKGSIEGATKWTAVSKTTDNGYVVEGVIPFKDAKTEGNILGVDFVLADNAGNWTRENMLLWGDKTGNAWANPSLFANVKLVPGIAKDAPAVEVKTDETQTGEAKSAEETNPKTGESLQLYLWSFLSLAALVPVISNKKIIRTNR